MRLNFRTLILLAFAICLSLGFGTTQVAAKTYHHRAHHKVSKVSQGKSMVRSAQHHLINLGYLRGRADGILGPKTKTAIKNFQRDHHFKATGILTKPTYNAIVAEDVGSASSTMNSRMPMPAQDFYATHPDYYGYYDQQYTNAMQGALPTAGNEYASQAHSQVLPSRFAKLDMSEEGENATQHYTITANGQPLFTADNQPAVIGVSHTFSLGDEDVIVLSTYRSESTVCPYKTYLLSVKNGGNNTYEVQNCTRGYQAQINQGSLYIVFPESDDGRVVGNTWRYSNGDLERL